MDGKETKGKGKVSHSKLDSSLVGTKRGLSKVKCFHCYDLGQYNTNCVHKKTNKKALGGAAGEALAS